MMKRAMIWAGAMGLAWSFQAQSAHADPSQANAGVSRASIQFTVQQLEKDHIELILSRHLAGSINPETAQHEIIAAADGAPISLIFDADGISAYLNTQDGATIHTLLKAHRAWLGLPEGIEIGFDVSMAKSPVIEFHRIYGLMELGTLSADLKTVVQDIESKEWRDTTVSLAKLLICAQIDKLSAVKGVPPVFVSWITRASKPFCSAD